jgi:hypothetical protein
MQGTGISSPPERERDRERESFIRNYVYGMHPMLHMSTDGA